MAFLTLDALSTQDFNKAESLYENQFKPVTKTIFISYRRKDKDRVAPVVSFLKSQGANVYIDYMDEALHDKPSYQTAAILRERIKQSAKFISMATPNSSESRWMPWELGLGDGFDGYKNVVVLPLTEQSNKWHDKEFYDMYGYIEKKDKNFSWESDEWRISYPDGSIISLKTWFNS